jgi:hypothetical protein
VIIELKVVLARSLACAPVDGLHELVALLVQLVETRQLLQVRGVVECLEEHSEAFLLVCLNDLDAHHETPFRIRYNPNKIDIRKKRRKNKSTHRLAAPSALVVLLARNEDIAELTQVASDLVRYEPEDTRALALLLRRVPRDSFGIAWRCWGI